MLSAFCLATLLFVPINIVIAATGALFGPLLGLLYALAGALVAAGLSFAVGRGLGRRSVRRLASRRINAVNKRLSQHGLLAMTVLRLLPIAPRWSTWWPVPRRSGRATSCWAACSAWRRGSS